jgi:two-component system response regulator YesN
MYKIVIADDEKIIREALCNTVPWESWGYEVVGVAKNGQEAVELLNKYQPDVFLTDVRMPKMDGLEVAGYINKSNLKIKIVISSGYNETAYLHEAIRNHVVAYLNKPINYEIFEETFKDLKLLLDEDRKKAKEDEELRNYLSESLPAMREMFFFDLMSGKFDSESIADKMKFYDIHIPQTEYAVLTAEVDEKYRLMSVGASETMFLMFRTLIYLLEHIFINSSFFYNSSRGIVVGIVEAQNITQRVQRLQREFLNIKETTISAGLSTFTHNISSVSEKWEEALYALRQKAFIGNEAIVFYDDVKHLQASLVVDVRRDIDELMVNIYYKEDDEIIDDISKLFSRLEMSGMKNVEDIGKICFEILFALEREVGTSKTTLTSYMAQKQETIFDFLRAEPIDVKRKRLIKTVLDFLQSSVYERKEEMSVIVMKAMEFIEKNYTNNTISLEMVADAVGKNPSYLSNLFKLETGKNFSEYLRELRMENAIEMLFDVSYKVYEIAEMVGYADVSSFAKAFKRHTGLRPGEYRKGSKGHERTEED